MDGNSNFWRLPVLFMAATLLAMRPLKALHFGRHICYIVAADGVFILPQVGVGS